MGLHQTPDQAYFNALQPIPVSASQRAETTYKTGPDCSNKPSHLYVVIEITTGTV
jgi:hypothetical protein